MPNWCENEMAVYGPKKDVERFVEVINRINDEADELQEWFTWRVYKELTGKNPGESENYIRGSLLCVSREIESMEDGRWVYYITYSSAWASMNEGWDEILTKAFPTLKQVTRAYEPGCEYAINTDYEGKCFPERIIVDASDDENSVWDWHRSREGVLNSASEAFGRPFSSFNEIRAYCKSRDGYCTIIEL